MVAKRVVPHVGGTIRPVVGPALMTIDRSICKILGVVSLSVEVYDSEDARKGVLPSESDPRIPFPVSALVVDSLAYDVILGHDFLNHFGLDIRYSESPTRIVGQTSCTVQAVQAANLSSRVQVYAPSSKEPDGNDEILNDSFDLSCPEYLPAGAGRKVAVMPLTDAELRDKGLPLLSGLKPSALASARPAPEELLSPRHWPPPGFEDLDEHQDDPITDPLRFAVPDFTDNSIKLPDFCSSPTVEQKP
ncbi:hypothetical protein FOL47_011334, partial [Perkinsus chesapeaki]